MAKPLKDETNMIIKYIREKTKDTDDWVLIGSRDLPKLFNISQIYTTKLLEPIKENPHVLYEVDDHFASRFKPYKFKWVDNEQEKIDHGLTAKQFFWLNEKEIEYIKSESDSDTYVQNSKLIKTCNLLAGDGAKKWWTPINIKDLSDLTVSTLKETEKRIHFMLSKDLLIKAKNYKYYRLVLDPDLIDEIREESYANAVKVKPKQERKKRKTIELHIVKDQFQASPENLVEVNSGNSLVTIDKAPLTIVKSILEKDYSFTPEEPEENTNGLMKNAYAIKNSISDTLFQLQAHIEQLKELGDKEEENRRSYEAFVKLGAEYEDIQLELGQTKEKLQKTEVKVNQFEHEIKMFCEHNEAFIMNAQARMDVLLGNVSGLLDEYILRPKFERNDEVVNSRLKIAIWNIVMDTSKAITGFKPESKYPPNLR